MKSPVKTLCAGLLLAIAGSCLSLSAMGRQLEESLGLTLLYTLRGPRIPSTDAVIINIDDSSSDRFNLPRQFSKWPRSIHADLVKKLNAYGAKVISFDIHFADTRGKEQDQYFAETIREAGNVLLVEELRHLSITAQPNEDRPVSVEMDTLIPPIKILADGAMALAPFPLPKIPVMLNTAWRFKPSCGNTPTFPVVVFQAANLKQYELFRSLILKKAPNLPIILPATGQELIDSYSLIGTMRKLRELFLQNKGLKDELLNGLTAESSDRQAEKTRLILRSLITMYGGESMTYIDLYGPPESLTTFSYYDILSSKENTSAESIANRIRDKVIFIGAAGKNWSNQKDSFYTVFTRQDGLNLSGVELAATVYANLSENRLVHQLSMSLVLAIIFTSALLSSLLSFRLTPPLTGLALLGTILIYLSGAYLAFARNAVWIPITIPAVILPVAAFILANLSNYLTATRERRNARKALAFYVPGKIAVKLSEDPSYIHRADTKVFGTCLLTDAQQYTNLSERMTPEDLSQYMKKYYRCLMAEVDKKNGLVCNIIGDSLLALWPSDQVFDFRTSACQAALHLTSAVDQFNLRHETKKLPTRIGLHCGYLLLDNIGTEDHYEYAPVGDIVNTVSRIEGLNKHLGTTILASQEAIQKVRGIQTREVGIFLLSGKTKPLTIFELSPNKKLSAQRHRLCKEAFPEALNQFRQGQWDRALATFEFCLTLQENDGPSLFYNQLCKSYCIKPPSDNWQGIVQVSK